MADERYYFRLNGRRVGPLGLEILQRMAQCGQIAPGTTLEREDGRQVNADKILFNKVFGGGAAENTPKEKTKKNRRASANANDEFRLSLEDESADNKRLNPFVDVENLIVAIGDEYNPFDCLPPLKERRSESRESAASDIEIGKSKKHGTKVVSAKPELFYVCDVLGRRRGPYSVVDLKRLAVEGRIEQNTTLETLLGKRGRAVEIRELALFFKRTETDDAEKLDGSQIFLIVFLCVLGAFLAVGVIVWALTHPLLLGRFLVYGAFGVLALGAAWYIGKVAYEYISEHSDAFSKALKMLLAVGAAIGVFVALWKLFGGWLLLALFGLFVLLIAAGSCN